MNSLLDLAKNDFDKLPPVQQERIVGRAIPKQLANYGVKDSYIDTESPDYLQFIIEGRAKWMIMQATELKNQLQKDYEQTKQKGA